METVLGYFCHSYGYTELPSDTYMYTCTHLCRYIKLETPQSSQKLPLVRLSKLRNLLTFLRVADKLGIIPSVTSVSEGS